MNTHKNEIKRFFDFTRNPYAWPGGYEIAMVTDDGELICHDCAKDERSNVVWSICHEVNDGWRPVAYEAFYEGGNHCVHCNRNLDNYGDEQV